MPQAVLTVEQMQPWETRDGTTLYLVKGWTTDGRWLTVVTVNAWLASLCDQSMQSKRPLAVRWRETRRDQRLVTAEFVAAPTPHSPTLPPAGERETRVEPSAGEPSAASSFIPEVS